jgi:hypothetical protein
MAVLVVGLALGLFTLTLAVVAAGVWITAAWRIVDVRGKAARASLPES